MHFLPFILLVTQGNLSRFGREFHRGSSNMEQSGLNGEDSLVRHCFAWSESFPHGQWMTMVFSKGNGFDLTSTSQESLWTTRRQGRVSGFRIIEHEVFFILKGIRNFDQHLEWHLVARIPSTWNTQNSTNSCVLQTCKLRNNTGYYSLKSLKWKLQRPKIVRDDATGSC